MRILVIIAILGFLVADNPPDTTKVKKDTVSRSYEPIQKKLIEQNIKLDSIILKLKSDTIK